MKNPSEIEPGEWYFGVLCKRCQNPILISHDLSMGVKPFRADVPKLLLRCQREDCGFEGPYESRRVQNFRAPYPS